MHERQPTLWINVTASANWKRPPVGIIRVERALADQLLGLLGPAQCRLCVWRDGDFVAWVEEPSQRQIDNEPASDMFLPRSGASFDLAGPWLSRRARRAAQGAARSGGSERPAPGMASGPGAARPMRGDFVISVGLDWDNDYTHLLHALSQCRGVRFISFCHDLIPVVFPQYCAADLSKRFTEHFTQLTWGSEAVLCNSEQTRHDYTQLCRELGMPVRKSVVVPLGDNIPGSEGVVGAEVRAVAQKPFILFVSTIERRKNHEVLYRAYHLLARRGLASSLPQLVFVGMAGWGVGDLLKDIELDPLTQGLVVQLHNVTDSELSHLYRQAAFCVYPSLYEGWGLPVGEALAMGKAVIASATGSLPEVGGDLVRYVDPWDVYAWAEALQEWVEHPDLVTTAELRVRETYQPRQWRQAAVVIADMFKALSQAPQSPLVLLPGYDLSTAEAGIHLGPRLQASGVAGLLSFGPHWRLSPGHFVLHVYGGVTGGVPEPVSFELRSDSGRNGHGQQRVVADQPAAGMPLATLRFSLEADVDDFELLCRVDTGSSLHIDRVEIVKEGANRPGLAAAGAEGALAT